MTVAALAKAPEPPRCCRPQCRQPLAVVVSPVSGLAYCVACALKLRLPVPACYGPCLMLTVDRGAWRFRYAPNLTEPVTGPQVGRVDAALPVATNVNDATADAVGLIRMLGLPAPPEYRDSDWWQATDKETGVAYHVLLNRAGEALASAMMDEAATVEHATAAEIRAEEGKR